MAYRFRIGKVTPSVVPVMVASDGAYQRRTDTAGDGRFARGWGWVADDGSWRLAARWQALGHHRQWASIHAELAAALDAVTMLSEFDTGRPIWLLIDHRGVVSTLHRWLREPGVEPDWAADVPGAQQFARTLHRHADRITVRHVTRNSHPLHTVAHDLSQLAVHTLGHPRVTAEARYGRACTIVARSRRAQRAG